MQVSLTVFVDEPRTVDGDMPSGWRYAQRKGLCGSTNSARDTVHAVCHSPWAGLGGEASDGTRVTHVSFPSP